MGGSERCVLLRNFGSKLPIDWHREQFACKLVVCGRIRVFRSHSTMLMRNAGCSSFVQERPRARIILTAEQAIEIYGLKPVPRTDLLKLPRMRGLSLPIAKKYGVSPKTIRDIWNRRTWAFATVSLLPSEHDVRKSLNSTHSFLCF